MKDGPIGNLAQHPQPPEEGQQIRGAQGEVVGNDLGLLLHQQPRRRIEPSGAREKQD